MNHRGYRVRKANGDNSEMRQGAGHSSDIGTTAISVLQARGKHKESFALVGIVSLVLSSLV